jgi:hypothetical protein
MKPKPAQHYCTLSSILSISKSKNFYNCRNMKEIIRKSKLRLRLQGEQYTIGKTMEKNRISERKSFISSRIIEEISEKSENSG